VQQANAAAKTILGFASLSGFGAADIFRNAAVSGNGDTGVPVSDLIARTLRERGTLRRVEAEYHTPAGERRVIGLTVSQVNDRGGALMGTACLISDLTEIADLTRQVRLQENMASLGEMSAGIAHEFKNSLATISGYAQMLSGDSASPEAREFGNKIGDETNNLTRIVTDFLNFAKPQGMNRETIALRPMLEACARESGIAADLSAVPTDMAVSGDSTALRQVFSNLMRNSLEAASKDVAAQVVIQSEEEDGRARIRLKDNGTGIPQERLSKIFIPFFTTKSKGTGLGLALVHRIITDHGGAISVESSEDGTIFTVVLPMQGP
jgi:signal transduction histidine kinase